MARKRFHSLRRPKIRADWSRWTLYNLSRAREPRYEQLTFFDQKWKAKSLARAYHGEYVREGKWQLMFDRRLPAVIPMDAEKLARSDGREASAGRGSGIEEQVPIGQLQRTPYSPMIFWPMERRLDTAVWRALFASSALQARQFVVHGSVKVNGKVMRHPGYLLNPGDMFQVDPERVMYGTGARKYEKDNPNPKPVGLSDEASSRRGDAKIVGAEEDIDEIDEEAENEDAEAEVEEELKEEEAETPQDPKKALKELLANAKKILDDPKELDKMSAKQKQRMRAFRRQLRTTMSRIRGDSVKTSEGEESAQDTVEELQKAMAELLGQKSEAAAGEAEEDISPERDAKLLRSALDTADENKIFDEEGEEGEEQEEDAEGQKTSAASDSLSADEQDASKPYATPWVPRDYMSAFAFVPRYLEVHHAICSAVYLRHPVTRPGLAEIPTPYSEELYELAHNWYLRRR